MVTVNKDGCGLIDSITYNGRKVIDAKPGFIAGTVRLALAGDGAIGSLFGNKVELVLEDRIDSVQTSGRLITIKGSYSGGDQKVPFVRRIELHSTKSVITVTEQADFTALDAKFVVGEHRLELPLVIHTDPHLRMLAFGGQHRVEMFRMDMNDVSRRGYQNISDNRGFQPYWDIGGVVQTPDSYRVWKANHNDTMAYPIEEGDGAPGWADYSELKWGITASVIGPAKAATWAINIDARKGVFAFAPHPSSQMPISGADYGKRKFAFELELHETSWPAKHPCELDPAIYEQLLKFLKAKRYISKIGRSIGTANIATIVHRERVQPSIALRALYANDAWPMQALMKSIGKNTPRNQSMAKWDASGKQFLDHIRKNGVPAIKESKPRPARSKR